MQREKYTVVEWHDCTSSEGRKVLRVSYEVESESGLVREFHEDLPVIIGPDDWEVDPWEVDESSLNDFQRKLYKQIENKAGADKPC